MVLDAAGHARTQEGRSGANWPDHSDWATSLGVVADPEPLVILYLPGLAKPAPEPGGQLARARAQAAAAQARAAELRHRYEQVMAEAHALKQITAAASRQWRSLPRDRKLLQRSEYLRLVARLETMPVIEQAKGIIMVQSRCGAAVAFDLLRRASQRSNVPVRDLAAQMVANASGTPSPPPQRRATWAVPPGTRAPRRFVRDEPRPAMPREQTSGGPRTPQPQP